MAAKKKLDTSKIINKGKKQGFITQEEVLKLFPDAEDPTRHPEGKGTILAETLTLPLQARSEREWLKYKIDIARYSVAGAAGDLISDHTKRRDILQLEDPDGEEKLLLFEEAERLSPGIKLNRLIEGLIEQEHEFEAELLSAEMGVSLKAMLAGTVTQIPKVEERQEPQAILPLFGKGGKRSSAKKAAELQAEPRAEEGEE